MFKKVFVIPTVLLVLALHTSANGETLQCGDKTPEDCMKELTMKMDKIAMMTMGGILKKRISMTIDMMTIIKDKYPKDDNVKEEVIAAIERMRNALPLVDKFDGMDMKTSEETFTTILMSMLPKFQRAAEMDKYDTKEYNKLEGEEMDKLKDEMAAYSKEKMKAAAQSMTELFNGLRDEDMKKYTTLTEAKTMIDAIKTDISDSKTDGTKSFEDFLKIMNIMNNINETPFTAAMVKKLCDKC